MPTTLINLHAIEAAIEPAWKTILSNAGINAEIEFSDNEKATPYVDVQLTDIVPTGHVHNYVNLYWFDVWKGTLVSRVVTQRGKNSAQQPTLLAGIRIAANPQLFTTALLPYHNVDALVESGCTRGVDPDHNLDWSELRHTITFSIRKYAWP